MRLQLSLRSCRIPIDAERTPMPLNRLVPIAVLALLLAACGDSSPPTAPADRAAAEVAAAAKIAPAPAEKPKPELPEGKCGDQSAVPADQRIANTPKWTTASEVDNFGYDVYRGDKEEGPFVKLTANPILGAGTTDETHKYEFRDDSIDPCKGYWYYVESTSTGGVHEKFTPVFFAGPKRRSIGSPSK